MPVNQLFKIIFYFFLLSYSLVSQKTNTKDSLSIKEILINKKSLKKQMYHENTLFTKIYHIKLNDLHRPNYFSQRNIPFHLNQVNFGVNRLNNRLSNLIDYDNIHTEFIDSVNSYGSYLNIVEEKINNYQPISNLIIDEGDYLYTYVDAFLKRRVSEDMAFYIGIRNIESSASLDNELENLHFKSKIEYNVDKDFKIDSYYFINAKNYDDIGITRIPHPDSIYQILDSYYSNRVFERKWINTFSLNNVNFTYSYKDYYESKKLSINDTINRINVYDHSFNANYSVTNNLIVGSELLLSHGNYFSKLINNQTVNAHAKYQKANYSILLSMDVYNSLEGNYKNISNEMSLSSNIIFQNSKMTLELSSRKPSYNIMYYERNDDYLLSSNVNVSDDSYDYYANRKVVNSEISNEKLFYLSYKSSLDNWDFEFSYTNVTDRINYNLANYKYENGLSTTHIAMQYQSKIDLLNYFGMRWDGSSSLINENSLYPDHRLNFEFYSNFTLFKNLESNIVLGTDVVINQNLNHYVNYNDFFYPGSDESISYVQPYVKAKFTIKDIDFILKVRNPLKVNAVMNKGYKSFAYGTTFKILWSFYD